MNLHEERSLFYMLCMQANRLLPSLDRLKTEILQGLRQGYSKWDLTAVCKLAGWQICHAGVIS